MKKIFLLVAMTLLLGCNSNLDKINGKWRCDPAATLSIEDDGARAKIMSNNLSKDIFIKLLSAIALQVDAPNKKCIVYILGQQLPINLENASESGNTVSIEGKGGRMELIRQGSDILILNGMPGGPDGLKALAFRRVSE